MVSVSKYHIIRARVQGPVSGGSEHIEGDEGIVEVDNGRGEERVNGGKVGNKVDGFVHRNGGNDLNWPFLYIR